jgi:hypothetical protein
MYFRSSITGLFYTLKAVGGKWAQAHRTMAAVRITIMMVTARIIPGDFMI